MRIGLVWLAAPVAEEHQEASSKNTIGELADATTAEATMLVSGQPLYRKNMREHWLKNETGTLRYCDESYFWTMKFHNTNDKLVTEIAQVVFVATATMVK